MDLLELITKNPSINITVSGQDLLKFHQDIALKEAQKAITGYKEKKLTRRETWKELGICDTTLWNWDRLGLIVGFKTGGKKYYLESEVRRADKANKRD